MDRSFENSNLNVQNAKKILINKNKTKVKKKKREKEKKRWSL